MRKRDDLNVFLKPESVAVIGASERPGSWGFMIMQGLLSSGYKGKIFPVNKKAKKILGVIAFKDIRDIPDSVDLAIFTIPEQSVEKALSDCGEKKVKCISLVTAGFGEIFEDQQAIQKEEKLVKLAQSYGIRILGPNISGTFNLNKNFNASAGNTNYIFPTHLGAVCQGGFAFYDLLASRCHYGMGVGKFVHTGNECDLTVSDFLEYYYHDPEVHGILMYLETVRDGKRFMEIIREVTRKKPVIVYKAGVTPGSARAARSHTGALAGRKEIFTGAINQLGVVLSPTMELMVQAGHALIERPMMRGNRVGIVTIGGSWGVTLADFIEKEGLFVPEFSHKLQNTLKSLGMPPRASTRNPLDIGASGLEFQFEYFIEMAKAIISSNEVDALVLHGFGNVGMTNDETPNETLLYNDYSKQIIQAFDTLQNEMDFPVVIGSHYSPWESQVVLDINAQGIRMMNRIDEIAQILALMYDFYKKQI